MERRDGRDSLQLRPFKLTLGYTTQAEGSALVELGRTRVLVTVTIENGIPRHVQPRRSGWLMAEYNLLPRATATRTARERFRLGGRTQEIQRFLGRAFRAALDLSDLAGKTVIIDADVLQADGGTRMASILGGYAALHLALDRMVQQGSLDEWPLTEFAAVSLGWFGEERILLDLDAEEDQHASADLTVVATEGGELIEIHGGGEGRPVPRSVYVKMARAGLDTVGTLVRMIHKQLAIVS